MPLVEKADETKKVAGIHTVRALEWVVEKDKDEGKKKDDQSNSFHWVHRGNSTHSIGTVHRRHVQGNVGRGIGTS